jgi:hypothetical protein
MALADEKAYLKALLEQRTAIATGGLASYTVPGRSVTKLSLSEINAEIQRTESRIARMSGGGVSYANFTAASIEGG